MLKGIITIKGIIAGIIAVISLAAASLAIYQFYIVEVELTEAQKATSQLITQRISDANKHINAGRECINTEARNATSKEVTNEVLECFIQIDLGLEILATLYEKYKSKQAINLMIEVVSNRLEFFKKRNKEGKFNDLIQRLKEKHTLFENKQESADLNY